MKASKLFIFDKGRTSLQGAVYSNLLNIARTVHSGNIEQDAMKEVFRYTGIRRQGNIVYMPLVVSAFRDYDVSHIYARTLFCLPYCVLKSDVASIKDTKIRVQFLSNDTIISIRIGKKWMDFGTFDWDI